MSSRTPATPTSPRIHTRSLMTHIPIPPLSPSIPRTKRMKMMRESAGASVALAYGECCTHPCLRRAFCVRMGGPESPIA